MSTLKGITKRASKIFRRDYSAKDEEKGLIFDFSRKRSQKRQTIPEFDILPESSSILEPVSQLPALKELGKRKKVKKAKSLAVIPARSFAAQDVADAAADSFRQTFSMEAARDRTPKLMIPGAFPSSSSGNGGPSPLYQVSPLPSPFRAWLTYDKVMNESSDTIVKVKPIANDRPSSIVVSLLPSEIKAWLTFDKGMNQSTETIVRREPDSGRSTPAYLQDVGQLPRSATYDSMWTTTTEDSSEAGAPLKRQSSVLTTEHPNLSSGTLLSQLQRLRGIMPSASTTSSVRELPPQRYLRHRPKLPSSCRYASEESAAPTTENQQVLQASQRSSKFHLPTDVSRSKLRWGDLSSNVSSLGSGDIAKLRKEMRLPSRRVSTPDLSHLRRAEEFVEGLSEQPYAPDGYTSFFDHDSSEADNLEQHSDNVHYQQQDTAPEVLHHQQPNTSFFSPIQPAAINSNAQAIINNLYEAVKRVDIELARVQLENRQLVQAEEEANARAAFWEERIRGVEAVLQDRMREKDELVQLLRDNGVEIPVRLLGGDAGYDGDLSNTTGGEQEVETVANKQWHATSGQWI